MADDELDLNHDGVVTGDASFGVRKDIALKLKPSPSKGKRGRKPSKHKKDEARDDTSRQTQGEYEEEVQLATMKGPTEPQHRNKKLRWDHKVHLIGEKVLDPLIHCCEHCGLPILLYGRMIPCKHVFCFDCARKTEKKCPRCHDAVQRIEQAALGTVFVCTHGGAKHGVSGCRRTYLSSRDLQAHIQYRHLREQPPPAAPASAIQPQQQPPPATVLHTRQDYVTPTSSSLGNLGTLAPPIQQAAVSRPPGIYPDAPQQILTQAPPPLSLPQTFTSPPPPVATNLPPPNPQQPVVSYSQPLPPGPIESYHTLPANMGARNLITIPIQGGGAAGAYPSNPATTGPPPNYPPPRGFPPASFASTGGPPLGPPPPRHLAPRPGGGPPVSAQGMPPRYPPGQTPPYNTQAQQQGQPWQQQPPNPAPPRGPPPPHGPGVGPPRY